MERTIKIGTFAVNGINRGVYVTLRLKDNEDGKPIFSCSGEVKRCAWGQCYETIDKAAHDNPRWKVIYKLWRKYHLNDLHAGTEAQEKALEQCPSTDYEERCEYLKSVNLYEDNGYKYGSAWLYRAIPEKDLKAIRHIIGCKSFRPSFYPSLLQD